MSVLPDQINFSVANPVQIYGMDQNTGNMRSVLTDGAGKLLVAFTGTSVISGTVNQGTPGSIANSWFFELTDGTNVLGTSAHPVRTDPTGTTIQPVSGTVTANIGTTNGLALDATLTGGTTKVRCTGNAGANFDAATAANVPANAVQQGTRGTTALPTAVTDGQLVAPMTDKYGRQVTVNAAVRDLVGTASVNASAASGTALIASGGAGVFTDIITLIITNETATATIVSVTDGTTTYKFALAANGGIVINFPTPLPATSSATAWTCGNSATVALDYVVVYAKNK